MKLETLNFQDKSDILSEKSFCVYKQKSNVIPLRVRNSREKNYNFRLQRYITA